MWLCYLISLFVVSVTMINPSFPTCFRSVNGSFIDKFIDLSSGIMVGNITNIPSFSDHSAILIEALYNTAPATKPDRRFDFDHADMVGFNKYVERHTKQIVVPLFKNIDIKSVDTITGEYNTIIQNALSKFIPLARTNTDSRIILSSQTRALQKQCKNRQRKLFRNANAPLHVRLTLVNQITGLRIMIRNSCNNDTSKFFSNTFSNISSTTDAFRVIRNFTTHKKKRSH